MSNMFAVPVDVRSVVPGQVDAFNWSEDTQVIAIRNQSPDPSMLMTVFVSSTQQIPNLRVGDVGYLKVSRHESIQVGITAGPFGFVGSYAVGKVC